MTNGNPNVHRISRNLTTIRWLKNGTVETLAYEFDQPYTVSNVQVYWLDFDHYDGDFRVPESWKLYYKEGESWKEVEALTEYTVKKKLIKRLF